MPFDPAIRQLIANFRRSPVWDHELDLKLLQALWPRIVGSGLGNETSVERVDGEKIVVRVPDQTWERQLRAISPRLLRRINEPWPNTWIKEIGFIYENKYN